MDKASQIVEFWAWFSHNDAGLSTISSPDHPLLDRALQELHKVNSDLAIELSTQSAPYECIISAQGNEALFPLVEAIAAKAPQLEHWTVIALKPPLGFEFVHSADGHDFDPQAMYFEPLTRADEPQALGLRVFIPLLKPEDKEAAETAVWRILETGLGEKMCAETIRHVEVETLIGHPEAAEHIRFAKLPQFMEWRKRQPC